MASTRPRGCSHDDYHHAIHGRSDGCTGVDLTRGHVALGDQRWPNGPTVLRHGVYNDLFDLMGSGVPAIRQAEISFFEREFVSIVRLTR